MADTITTLHGVPVLLCDPAGAAVADDAGARDLIGAALGMDVEWVAVPAQRLADDFFVLRTQLAGQVTQKFVNYRLKLAVVGDISDHLARSSALRDFVREANRGRQLWFVPTLDEMERRLAG